MLFIKPLIPRIFEDINIQEELNKIENDTELIRTIKHLVSMDKLSAVFKDYYGVDLIDLEHNVSNQSISNMFEISNLNREVLEGHSILPYRFDEDRNIYYFAMSDFLNESLRQSISRSTKRMGGNARFGYSPRGIILEKYEELGENEDVKESDVEEEAVVEVEEVVDEGEFNVQEWVDGILMEGIKKNASDVHIEPLEENLQVRYRIDGQLALKKVHQMSENNISSVMVRLKIISGMDISEKRKPQDGRINNYEYQNHLYDMRVSTVVTVYGEKGVIRISNKTSGYLTYEELGFSEEDSQKVRRLLSNQNGILYIAGATGSGKTTTLYSMINELNTDVVNMYTIEDPVEQTIDNVNQIEIDTLAGITFPSTLRALLRQDPDVIVVGEIRDIETAELSVQASLTGHLVLSTIHANNALESVNRLLNMGVEPYLIVGSSLGFLSQRLVRKVCDECKVPYDGTNQRENAWIEHMEEEHNIKIDKSKLYQAGSCERCSSGYSGRVAVVEMLEMSESIQELILNGEHMSVVKEQALKEGYTPLVLNGIQKALDGVTTISELMRELT